MPLYQQQEGVPTFFILPATSCIRCSLPTYQPEDSGLVPAGFLMLDLWNGASSSTRTQSSSLFLPHILPLWWSLVWAERWSFLLGCSFPLSAYFQAPFRPW